MADDKQVMIVAVGAGVVGALWYLMRTGKAPAINLDQRAFGDVSYSPFVHWMHQSPHEYLHHYPATVAPLCLPQVIQNESVGLALPVVEVDSASYAQ